MARWMFGPSWRGLVECVALGIDVVFPDPALCTSEGELLFPGHQPG